MKSGRCDRGLRLTTVLALVLIVTALGCASGGSKDSSRKSNARRHLRYGRLMFEQGRTAEAIESIEKAIKTAPDMAESYNLLGVIYLQRSQFDKAKKQFKVALRIDPYYTDAHNHLGVAFRELGEYDKALEEFQAALADRGYRTPEKIHLNLGHLYLERKQTERAIESFEQAVVVNPNYLRAILALGMAFRQAGQDGLARDKFLKVVELGPDTVEGRRAQQLLDGKV